MLAKYCIGLIKIHLHVPLLTLIVLSAIAGEFVTKLIRWRVM